MRFSTIAHLVIDKVRREGVLSLLRTKAVRRLLGRPDPYDGDDTAFDKTYGTDTGGTLSLWKYDLPNIDSVRLGRLYMGINEARMLLAVGLIGPIDRSNFTFIDLGCGKGRAILIASRLGFRKVIGIDIVPDLVAIANNNIKKLNLLDHVSAVVDDAFSYTYPNGNLVVLVYNSFWPEGFVRALEHLKKHKSGEIYFIYVWSQHEAVIDSLPYLQPLNDRRNSDLIRAWKYI